MSDVVFGKKRPEKKIRVNKETFKAVAKALGIDEKEFNQLMADNPRAIYIYRERDASDPGGGGGGGGGGHGSGG